MKLKLIIDVEYEDFTINDVDLRPEDLENIKSDLYAASLDMVEAGGLTGFKGTIVKDWNHQIWIEG